MNYLELEMSQHPRINRVKRYNFSIINTEKNIYLLCNTLIDIILFQSPSLNRFLYVVYHTHYIIEQGEIKEIEIRNLDDAVNHLMKRYPRYTRKIKERTKAENTFSNSKREKEKDGKQGYCLSCPA